MGSKSREQEYQLTWTMTIWVEDPGHHPQTWAGLVRTAAGQQWEFRSLGELERLLCELGGWTDPPDLDASNLMPADDRSPPNHAAPDK